MEPSTAQTIGELIEGQRQTNGRLDRLESKVDRLEAKVDKALWVGLGIIGSVLASLITAIVFALQ